jgi:hypothetical protein
MKGLFGIDALHVELDEQDCQKVNIVVDVCGMKARLTLDLENGSKLCAIKVWHMPYAICHMA